MRLLQIIDKSFLGKFIAKKQELIAATDPNRIYVENIRSFFNIPNRLAKLFCNLAVREGVFREKIGIICYNKDCERIILSVDNLDQMPSVITCQSCQLREESEYDFNTASLSTIIFYQIVRKNGK
ncbi:hypothetical protein FBD94_01035 [Pedobacter hiemivivus]|uniref:Uncharacterized protein n=1 Tax=Pedobacter hiemivivus TaxID=2530454 RepID=A0A4U1GPU3_9SPHI|nr:hypothetical protein [Pedobacter hiemivivus]TKC65173.1 hypothetical protein FBD94_01035 [Pedobacter hiemivivus]